MNKNKKKNNINKLTNSNTAFIYNKKAPKDLDNHRMILFTYYKNSLFLQVDNKNEFNYKGRQTILNYTNHQQNDINESYPKNSINSPNVIDYINNPNNPIKENHSKKKTNDYNINQLNNTGSSYMINYKSNQHNSNNESNSQLKEENINDLYNKFGKYKTYLDSSNEKVYYTDKNLYNYRKKEYIQNFEYNSIGFANIGNACYMNAFLQILMHSPNFLKKLRIYNPNDFDSKTLLHNLLYLSQYPYNTDYLYNIKDIMKEINSEYGTFTPGDSQIFAIDFLDKLIYEIKGENSSDNDSYESNFNNFKMSKKDKYNNFLKELYRNKNKNMLEKLFQFSEVSKGTDNNKYSFTVNLNIELAFPKNKNISISLIELLEEKYQVNNKNIGKYNTYNKKVKLTNIADIPEILIISLVRSVSGRSIIKASVSFSDILDIGPYLDSELKEYNKIKNTEYLLYAVNERYGQTKSQGHYVSYIKIKNAIWYRFSDLFVHQSNPSYNSDDVFGLYYIRKDCIE